VLFSGSAEVKIKERDALIRESVQKNDISMDAKNETLNKKKCMPWEIFGKCYRHSFGDFSSPEKTFEALKKFLQDEEVDSYNSLFCWRGLKNDAKYDLYSFSPKNLEECYRKKILHEQNHNCIEETRSNSFVESLIRYRLGRFDSPIQSVIQNGTILKPSDLNGGKTNLSIKKMRLQNGEEFQFLEMKDKEGKKRYKIIDRFDVD